MASQHVTLSQKDRKAFQDLLSCYELKQLTRGRKVADQILKKYPDHGGKGFSALDLECLVTPAQRQRV